jgi:hypothetical protein
MIFMIDSSVRFAKGFLMKLSHPLSFAVALAFLLSAGNLLADVATPFRHFVSFQFREGTSDEKKTELVKAFLQLKQEIDVNIEPLNDGFTHSFLVTFKDKSGLATYLPHPAHETFVAKIKPHLEKVYVFDYAPGK